MKPHKGLHTDNSFQEQPENTYRFALNAINETELGDLHNLSNEDSNEICGNLKKNYIPIGKVYVGNNETLIFSVSKDEKLSELGLINTQCEYKTIVNADLKFKVTSQIDATFKLRRGCERTVYWVDGDNNKPRHFNLDKENNFKSNGKWDIKKFELIRSYNKIPVFNKVEVLNSNGQLEPGSYNIAIQYLNEDLNPTEWITTSEIINIYNDNTTESFLEIRGSINSEDDFRNYPTTEKSIKVYFSNLDEDFLFYRLAFIEATKGNGLISSIKYTSHIPTNKNFYIYTGLNFQSKGTESEIATFNEIISSAGSIEQVENRLLLANTKGKQINFCSLQKYASRIKADVITKKIFANNITSGNTKNPTCHFEGVGYMPGEIYSFGIVYIFRDGTLSPVYHIPGKSPEVSSNAIFANTVNTYGMSNDNSSKNNVYTDNNACSNEEYWGVDSQGNSLKNQKVRHHRFPLRSDLKIPLVKEESFFDTEEPLFRIDLSINGTIDTPCTQDLIDTGQCKTLKTANTFQVKVEYEFHDGVKDNFIVTINPDLYINNTNKHQLNLKKFSSYTNSAFKTIKVYESKEDGTYTLIGKDIVSPKGLKYVAVQEDLFFDSTQKIYSTEIFGIKFSGIDLPPSKETNNEEIVGYYIVRNERLESDKTILDSAVLTPTVINQKYVSCGLLGPEVVASKLSKNTFGLIHPEHKFNNKKYNHYTQIIDEGYFNIETQNKSICRYLDVQEGTSYNKDKHNTEDEDGWSLKIITRDNITKYDTKKSGFGLLNTAIDKTFYLDALQSRQDESDEIYNISGDNTVGIIKTKSNLNFPLKKFPYVYLKRDIADHYSNFRILPYKKESLNVEVKKTCEVFNGDTYISPVRYVNTMFWDNRISKRASKRGSIFNVILGGLLIVTGAILSFVTLGASTIAIGVGLSILGGGALLAASGFKQAAWEKAYGENYKKGLRETVLDSWVEDEYKYKKYKADTPGDDEIQWLADCVTDFWFESQINTSLRYKIKSNAPDFLDAPGKIETGNDLNEEQDTDRNVTFLKDVSIYPHSKLDYHIIDKLLAFNPKRKDNKQYIGHCLGEWYKVNPDYERINKQKVFFHLPTEYDCCSKCQENFPHRIYYSEQSFQEELTDNFKSFLPNNYRDIEAETGEITDLFRIKNNLYIHTEESLWHLPQNYQERITNDIVSFIGTGSYFSVPPRKIQDSDFFSGGCKHNWATLKTKYGVFFVSEKERKIYQFDGQQLKPISDIGTSNWFKENSNISLLDDYYKKNGKKYPFDNNPSNKFGVGFLSVYDSKKERIIFTKKDFKTGLINKNAKYITKNGEVLTFKNYEKTIKEQQNLDYVFKGIEDFKLKFEKTNLVKEEVDRDFFEEKNVPTISMPNDTDIIVAIPTDNIFSRNTFRDSIRNIMDSWHTTFKTKVPNWTGNFYYYIDSKDTSESKRAWKILKNIKDYLYIYKYDGNTARIIKSGISNNIGVISFVNENSAYRVSYNNRINGYHEDAILNSIRTPYDDYRTDVIEFEGLYTNNSTAGGSFRALLYPLLYERDILNGLGNSSQVQGFLQHALAAFSGLSYSDSDFNTETNSNAIPKNPVLTDSEWNTLKSSLKGNNPYYGILDDPGLSDYGWKGVWDATLVKNEQGIYTLGINETKLKTDIDKFFLNTTKKETIKNTKKVKIKKPVIETKFIEPEKTDNFFKFDNSWSMSFSLKNNSWTSFHSYIPNFYFFFPEKFFSWKSDNDNFWLHNKKGNYQKFYNKKYPFIIEYVSVSKNLQTKIWNDIILFTEAKKYNEITGTYVDDKYKTFNKAIFYNTQQCTGNLILKIKDKESEDFMIQQVLNIESGTIFIDRNERNWSLNNIRDIRINYNEPIFNENQEKKDGYIDKVLNEKTLDIDKNWLELEPLRDKFLVVRLIFDKFEDVKLLMNYSVER